MGTLRHSSGVNVKISGLRKYYGERRVLDELEVEMKAGEFMSIVGKSGCGKSTLLRLIAGLESFQKGAIMLNGDSLEGLNDKSRMMFQDGRLLPWKRVIDNVSLGLPKEERAKAEEALSQVGLSDRMSEFPAKLSGGQRQRVALARALAHDPEILLLDEPLGALDALTRLEMQDLIENLWNKRKFTSILVTHDVEEAVAMADRVLLMEEGKITLSQEIALPRPRKRTNPAFNMYVEEILARIMDRKVEKQMLATVHEKELSLLDSVNN